MELKTRLKSFFCDFNRLVNVKGLDVALNCGNHHFKIKGDASCAGYIWRASLPICVTGSQLALAGVVNQELRITS